MYLRKLKTKNIYIVRHGETDFNKRGIVQGSGIDAPLNDKGRRQAQAFFENYNDVVFEKIYTSKLIRTQQSVQAFIDKPTPHQKLEGLNEINWGEKEGQVVTTEDNKYYWQILKEWQKGNTSLKIAGGESPEDVQSRQKDALKTILNGDESDILICMHGRALRVFMCLMLNKPLKDMDDFAHSNLCLYKLLYNEDEFLLQESNKIDHLAGLL